MNIYQREITAICNKEGITDEATIKKVINDVYCSGLDFSECEQYEFDAQVLASIQTIDINLDEYMS